MSDTLPGAAGDVAKDHPSVWEAYAALGEATAKAGPLNDRERRLVKLALAIGAGSEGAVHSHARRAGDDEVSAADMEQIVLLAIGPLGFPRAIAARTWISDVTND